LPFTLFYVLVHMAKPGYLLPLAPAMSLAMAFHYGQERRAGVLWALALGHLALGAAFFLTARPWSGPEIGEGTSYAKRSFVQKTKTELNALAFPTWHTIRQADAQLFALREAVGVACHGDDGVLIVGEDGPGLNWRRLMYSFPGLRVLRLPAATSASLLIARQTRYTEAPSPVELQFSCATFWVIAGDSELRKGLSGQTETEANGADGAEWFVTRGGVATTLRDGVQLALARTTNGRPSETNGPR